MTDKFKAVAERNRALILSHEHYQQGINQNMLVTKFVMPILCFIPGLFLGCHTFWPQSRLAKPYVMLPATLGSATGSLVCFAYLEQQATRMTNSKIARDHLEALQRDMELPGIDLRRQEELSNQHFRLYDDEYYTRVDEASRLAGQAATGKKYAFRI